MKIKSILLFLLGGIITTTLPMALFGNVPVPGTHPIVTVVMFALASGAIVGVNKILGCRSYITLLTALLGVGGLVFATFSLLKEESANLKLGISMIIVASTTICWIHAFGGSESPKPTH